ncbi:MAG: hypothetical protein ABSA26_00210 [Thermoguttaceae bacterium]|jgi:hypothetical protein
MLKHICTVTLLIAATINATALAAAEEPKNTNLPLKRVVLFNSGVGFFEHSGKVNGNATVEMKFKTDQINDLLKSMVVQDLDGGRISTVNYESKDPITKTLKTFSIDLTANPTLAQLLRQVRGERVELEAPNKLAGVILGVETRKKQIGEQTTIDIDVLNLLTDAGLRAVPMDTITTIKLTNEKLDAELRKALALLALTHAADKKSVELSFLGKGQRRVQVGYIQEAPVWKTTYRLVLSDEKPLLQGWAIVENTSEEDWNNVNLSLVSGRPISFVMDLYQPLYVPRPEAQLDLFASLRPQTYGQDLAKRENLFSELRQETNAPAKARSGGAMGGGMGRMIPGRMLARAPAAAAVDQPRVQVEEMEEGLDVSVIRGHGVQSVAQAAELGSLFQYKIDTPVSLPRQQSAMLPIVNADVKGEKVSIYNQNVQAKHPLCGLQFTNTSGLHLMQGPITVFDGGSYAGDAKIEDLPPDAQRLISYAVDLDTEVAPQTKGRPEELLSVRLLKGALIARRKYVREQEYTVKNSGKVLKKVLIEYPIDVSWKLVKPEKPAEKTRDLYRFAVEAKPGEPALLTVEEERTDSQHIAMNNLDDGSTQFYLRAKIVSDKVKEVLKEIVKRKAELGQLTAKKQQVEQRIREIGEDQTRIRQNMAQLDRNSDVYKNYVKKFSDQESEIEKLRAQTAALADEETGMRKSLDEYMMGLDLQ